MANEKNDLPAATGAHVVDVKECRVALVSLVDGYGEKQTRLAIIGPNGGMLLLDEKALSTREPQKWVKDAVLAKLTEVTVEVKEI